MNTSQISLFERIGGMNAVEAAVEIFYQKVLEDESISHFFASTDMSRMKSKQKVFLAYAFGAEIKYEGKDMRRAHASSVQMGLSNEHFDAVAGHLMSTLQELEVNQELIDEVMQIVGATRKDVLGE